MKGLLGGGRGNAPPPEVRKLSPQCGTILGCLPSHMVWVQSVHKIHKSKPFRVKVRLVKRHKIGDLHKQHHINRNRNRNTNRIESKNNLLQTVSLFLSKKHIKAQEFSKEFKKADKKKQAWSFPLPCSPSWLRLTPLGGRGGFFVQCKQASSVDMNPFPFHGKCYFRSQSIGISGPKLLVM